MNKYDVKVQTKCIL